MFISVFLRHLLSFCRITLQASLYSYQLPASLILKLTIHSWDPQPPSSIDKFDYSFYLFFISSWAKCFSLLSLFSKKWLRLLCSIKSISNQVNLTWHYLEVWKQKCNFRSDFNWQRIRFNEFILAYG